MYNSATQQQINQLRQQISSLTSEMNALKTGAGRLADDTVALRQSTGELQAIYERDHVENFAERMVSGNRISSRQRSAVVSQLLSLPTGNEANFSESEQRLTRQQAMDAIADGYDLNSLVLDQKVRDYAAKRGLDYSESARQLYTFL
jgi:regulator of replication initiation timing